VTDDQLLRFLVELTVLFLAARIGGEVAARLRLPLHVGELLMGIALGPSLLGWLWPGAFDALFPADAATRSLLDVVSWTGVIMLALLAGLETRLGILRTAGRAVLGGWIGGFGLPFAAGLALGTAAPPALVPPGVDRPVFALFLATAMSISAIPVIARILMDLKLYRTRVGMVILSTAIADDTVGWIVLAVVAGLAGGALELGPILRTVLLTAAFIVGAFTLGRILVGRAIRASRRLRVPFGELSAMLMLVFALAALTQWIGVHLVLGAFVAAILIGGEPDLDPDSVTAVRHLGMGLFIPFFFAYTGIKVDLTTLHGSALGFAAAAVAVACVSKILGGWAGTRLGGLPHWEALAVGFGLNARGAMELVIAAIGLSIGVLSEPMYATIVLIAVLTTVMAAPMLQFCVRRAGVEPEDMVPAGLEVADAPSAGSGTMITS
jgi:Kef-type K+ transport system membrane component KefB